MAGMHPTHSRTLSANGHPTDSTVAESAMEPNGTTKGQPTSSRSTATNTANIAPALPPNMNGMVQMSAIIHRMSNEAFSDLSNLSEV
jgi:hypothetical protein